MRERLDGRWVVLSAKEWRAVGTSQAIRSDILMLMSMYLFWKDLVLDVDKNIVALRRLERMKMLTE